MAYIPLEPADNDYYQECITDIRQMMYEVTVKRALPENSSPPPSPKEYPDDPDVMAYRTIYTRADYTGVTASEVEKSGGLLLMGDIKIWTSFELYGPETPSTTNPTGISDIVILQGHEYVVIGFPDHAEITQNVYPGYSAIVRRRATSYERG